MGVDILHAIRGRDAIAVAGVGPIRDDVVGDGGLVLGRICGHAIGIALRRRTAGRGAWRGGAGLRAHADALCFPH